MTKAYFENIEKYLVSNILQTKTELSIAVAWFTNPNIFKEVLNLLKKDKIINLIIANDTINFINNLDFQHFIENGGNLFVTNSNKLMHNKYCIIDSRILFTGSYNWTKKAEYSNFENVILSTEITLIEEYKNDFENLKANHTRIQDVKNIKILNYLMEDDIIVKPIGKKLVVEDQEINLVNIDTIDETTEENLEKAELFYLKGKHQEAINICDKILEKFPRCIEAKEIIANSKWKQQKFKEQIRYANEIIEIDNTYYTAYNILGIAYSHLGNMQKSIDNYEICISAEPNEYIYYKNRALSYVELISDEKIPNKLIKQFELKAAKDFKKVIELTTIEESENENYKLYLHRGLSLQNLKNNKDAKKDLLKALELYQQSPKNEQDTHELKELRIGLKEIG